MATNWTQAIRSRLSKSFPPDQLLPDKQPAYVRSAIYLFGALTIGSFALVILTGTILAIFGPQWWHTNAIGHFFNSLHLWSVEALFFFMVLHLWGTFFQGAWRDGRGRTWMTGVVTFAVSIVAAFTGYLSQSNFDSQWIAVSAKDAMNAIGVGGFFNVLNFGQMYGMHILVLPVAIIGLVALHILLVRLRGVVRPYLLQGEQRDSYTKSMTQEQYYRGVRMVPYDLVREVTVAGVAVLVLVVILAGAFSSPDDQPMTMQSVAQSDPLGFVTVSLSELAGDSQLAQYGPPYNTASGAVQSFGPISPQNIAGVSIPIDTAQVYVLGPLKTVQDATVTAAARAFTTASAGQQTTWEGAYGTALGKADGSLDASGHLKVAVGDYGPLPVMFGSLLDIARSGALDGLLLSNGRFYQTDYTKPLLFLNENALPARAGQLNLLGNQWGMMNETGPYPGQAWLWLYTFWYQVPFAPYTGPNADIAVWATMAILSLALIFLPYIPGLNSLPEIIGVHRLIWREHYRAVRPPARHVARTAILTALVVGWRAKFNERFMRSPRTP
ncbi:MAG: cytochrome b N-terminal domain-containing protein [Ktedonobacterales bacterium]